MVEDSGDWRGMARFHAHLAGPTLRDWPVAMAMLAESKPRKSPPQLAPLRFFNAQLPAAPADEKLGCRGRHVVLVLDEEDRPVRLDLHFMMHNQGTRRPVRVRVLSPDGGLVSDSVSFVEASKTDPNAVQGFAIDIPADGQKGVCALEIWSKQGALPTRVDSSAGKVVHYMPPGRRGMSSPVWGGQAWFQPEGDQEVVIGDPHGFPAARVVAFDPEGNVVGSSRITGTAESETRLRASCNASSKRVITSTTRIPGAATSPARRRSPGTHSSSSCSSPLHPTARIASAWRRLSCSWSPRAPRPRPWSTTSA